MRLRWLTTSVCLTGALAFGVAACGSDNKSDSGGGSAQTDSLTVYSSLPFQGASKNQSDSVSNGEKLALKSVGGKVGPYTIKYTSLDDSTAQNPGTADEAQTAQNARKAVQDGNAVLYLGEYNSGGTKVSLPILNKAGIPQISPANTYIGLTTDEPGSEPGEPDKYYPTGKRTYARVVPRDKIQGAALVTVMKEDGCKAVTLWDDKSTYGAGLARNIEEAAKAQSLPVQDRQGTDKNSANYRSLASNVKTDCFLWSGVTAENGVQVYKDVAAAAPDAKLYGPDGVTDTTFVDPKQGGIPADVGKRTKISVATLGVKDLPEAGPVLSDYKKTYNTQSVDPYAIYGYETMALALDALKRGVNSAGSGADVKKLRQATTDAIFNTKNRKSVLGEYSIDENGDTSLTDYGLYVIKDGQLTYDKAIKAQAQ